MNVTGWEISVSGQRLENRRLQMANCRSESLRCTFHLRRRHRHHHIQRGGPWSRESHRDWV